MRLAIVGGGAAAVCVSLAVSRRFEALGQRPPELTLYAAEGEARLGLGLAYGAGEPTFLLNAPAGRMSLDPDAPGAFAEAAGLEASAFAPRERYGRYVQETWRALAARHPGWRVRPARAESLSFPGEIYTIRDGSGADAVYDAVVLAVGMPGSRPLLPGLPPERVIAGPQAPGALAGLAPDARVAIAGTGLSMLDVASALLARGHRGPIVAFGPSARLPRAHAPGALAAPAPALDAPLSRLAHEIKGREDWRAVLDAWRAELPEAWRAWEPAKKRRFLRHARALFEVHRHRAAPEVLEAFEAARAAGRVTLKAGRLARAEATPDGALALGFADGTALEADWLVQATGFDFALRRWPGTLVRSAHASGLLPAEPVTGQGADVGPDGRVAGGGRLFALGALAVGAAYETLAMPELRRQASGIAEALAREVLN